MRRHWQFCRAAGPVRGHRTAIMLIVVFVALAFVTRLLCLDRSQASVFWAANSAMVAALLLLSWRQAVVVLGACLCANMVLDLITNYSLSYDLFFCALNVALSVAVAALTRRYCRANTDLSRFKRLVTFGFIAMGCAAMEAASGILIAAGPLDAGKHVTDWIQWTLCDGFALLIGTPPIMLFAAFRRGFRKGMPELWSVGFC